MLSRTIAPVARSSRCMLTNRTYSTVGKEPINLERGNSRTPFYIAGAVITMGLLYKFGLQATPKTPGVGGMLEATHPKTPGARQAAGLPENPHDRDTRAGGDQKAKKD